MSLKQSFHQVLSCQLDGHYTPKYDTISGVKVVFKPVKDGVDYSTWHDILEAWLPQFDDAGWLDGLEEIIIGEDEPRDNAVGEYLLNGYILLENDISGAIISGIIFEASEEYVLTHEMLHHAHKQNGGFDTDDADLLAPRKMQSGVSYYAGESKREAIAEIGAGIIHGNDIPDWAHDYYEENDGPMEVYDIG